MGQELAFPPSCHPEQENTPWGCFRVELSKICNRLLIFESQNAVRVLRICERYFFARRSRTACALPWVGFDFANNTQLFASLRMTRAGALLRIPPIYPPFFGVAFTRASHRSRARVSFLWRRQLQKHSPLESYLQADWTTKWWVRFILRTLRHPSGLAPLSRPATSPRGETVFPYPMGRTT